MRLKTKPQKRTLENTIPLINIVFLMLIFFLFAGSIDRDDAKNVSPAETQEQSSRELIAGALIIAPDGTMTQNEQPIQVEDLTPLEGSEEPLMVVADKALSGQTLARTLAALKKQGFSDVTLVTVRASQ
ncbi:ExbD/TolR family protein [Pseudovibrio denitrificans]|uniref:ExbD/TolR family protein n=1 Tax=Pseudovibrio TaxID=258255 RepID=UPI000186B76D|nr:biopolymer transporter ExbD [Pseudovibrio sp. JE062]EEA92406.1 transport energizing protein, ExbD/TolR family [Pseudovibrio sp. JE062]